MAVGGTTPKKRLTVCHWSAGVTVVFWEERPLFYDDGMDGTATAQLVGMLRLLYGSEWVESRHVNGMPPLRVTQTGPTLSQVVSMDSV